MKRLPLAVISGGLASAMVVGGSIASELLTPMQALAGAVLIVTVSVALHRTTGDGLVYPLTVVAALLLPLQSAVYGDVALLAAVSALVVDGSTRHRAAHGPAPKVAPYLLIVSVGGVIGALSEPSVLPYSRPLFYTAAPLAGIPAQYGEIIRFTVSTVGTLWFAWRWRPSAHEAHSVYFAFACGAALSLALGFSNTVGGRTVGVTDHPVFFGIISATGFMAAVAAALRGGRTRPLALILAAICLLGVLLSGTRSALLLVVVALMLVLLATRKTSVFLALGSAAIVALGAVLVLPGALQSNPVTNRLGGNAGAELSDTVRNQLRDETIDLIRARPLTGAGFRFMLIPHNLLVGTVAAAGVLGLVGLALLASRLTTLLLRAGRDDLAACAVLALAVSFLVCAWVVTLGWERWFWLPVAVAVSRAGQSGSNAVRAMTPTTDALHGCTGR